MKSDCQIYQFNFTIFQNLSYEYVKDVDFYNRIYDDTNESQSCIALFTLIILLSLFSFSILKNTVIFIYFFVVNFIISTYKCFLRCYKKKCETNCGKDTYQTYEYLIKIFKKYYTYNFYSYENKLYGTTIILVYLLYLFVNFCLIISHIRNNPQSSHFNFTDLITFEFDLFMEVFCTLFFIIRSKIKQLFISFLFFILLNVFVIFVVLMKIFDIQIFCDYNRYILQLVYALFFGIIFGIAIIKIIRYDQNCKYNKFTIFSRSMEMSFKRTTKILSRKQRNSKFNE